MNRKNQSSRNFNLGHPNQVRRYYIDDWYDLIVDILISYSENVSPRLDLEDVKQGRLWLDEDTNIHIEGIKDEITIELIRTAIQSRLLS